MQASDGHPPLRPQRLNTYTAYSIGFFATWAILFAILTATVSHKALGYFGAVFGGTVIGWTSATLARITYPPPKKRDTAGPTSFFQGYREN
jgi:hypothetical protein